MKIDNSGIHAAPEKTQAIIRDDRQMSARTKSMFEILILIITLLAAGLRLKSKHSGKPPSSDPDRQRRPNSKTGENKGGQKGHVGVTLQKSHAPDVIGRIKPDRRTPPAGQFQDAGHEARQAGLCRAHYRKVIEKGDIERPEPTRPRKKGERGWIERWTSRKVLARPRDYEKDGPGFVENEHVAFTSDPGENDRRMTTVHQKISGRLRFIAGARAFCRIRGYLSPRRKQGMQASYALELLFNGFERSDALKLAAKRPDWCGIISPRLVVKTPSALFTDALRPTEKARIACGKEHVKALGKEVEFAVTNAFEDFSGKYV